jgi:hypothetical protein
MTTFIVTAQAKLFGITRLVQAASRAEAAAQVDQKGILVMWIEEAGNDYE